MFFRKAIVIMLNKVGRLCLEKAGRIGPEMEYEAPTKVEKEKMNQNIIMWCSLLIMICIIVILVIWFAKFFYAVNSQGISFSEWNSSAGSFWGAILGAFVAGIVTIIANFMVIQRSYRVDYHRERLEVMPIFEAEQVHTHVLLSDIKNDVIRNKHDYNFAGVSCPYISGNAIVDVFEIRNIGRGIAYDFLTKDLFEEYEEEIFRGIIPPGKCMWLLLPLDKEDEMEFVHEFRIVFRDIFGNTYEQNFDIQKSVLQNIEVLTAPPELIQKTSRIRYVQ